MVFWCFMGIEKEINGMKLLNTEINKYELIWYELIWNQRYELIWNILSYSEDVLWIFCDPKNV